MFLHSYHKFQRLCRTLKFLFNSIPVFSGTLETLGSFDLKFCISLIRGSFGKSDQLLMHVYIAASTGYAVNYLNPELN